jgi:DNA-binding CsgD family transcriptional regulator
MAGVDGEALKTAIDRLYEAAVAPEFWPTALSSIAGAVGGFAATIIDASSPHDVRWEISKGDEALIRDYARGDWHGQNYRMNIGFPRARSGQKFVHELMLLDDRAIDRQRIQAEFFRPRGMRSFVGFEIAPGVAGSVERGAKPIDGWEMQLLEAVHPHFVRIGQLAQARGRGHADGALQALEALRRPAILLDFRGLVLGMTSSAERLVERAFHLRNGALSPRDPAARTAFDRMIGSILRAERPHMIEDAGFVTTRRPNGLPVFVRAAPIAGAGRDIFSRGKALLFLASPDEPDEVRPELIRSLFGLTPTEARLARILIQEGDVATAAELLHIGKGTIRTHLKSIFRKTRTSGQTELIAKLARVRDIISE